MSSQAGKQRNRFLLILALCGVLLYAAVILLSLKTTVTAEPMPSTPPSSSEVSSEQVSQPEPEPEPQRPKTDQELFENAAFIGNSCVERLHYQGFALDADFLSGVGLTVHSVYTTTPPRLKAPVVDLLASDKKYDRIYVLFGINEVGNDPQQFITQYGVFVDYLKAHQPQATIYIQSILPVTRAKHEKNQYLVNNDNIRTFNALIQQMAQKKGVEFLDIYQSMVDADGFLPDAASFDGVHLSKDYNQVWINYLKENVK